MVQFYKSATLQAAEECMTFVPMPTLLEIHTQGILIFIEIQSSMRSLYGIPCAVFKYTAGLHTVVELAGEKEYEKCDMSSALDSKKGGNTVVKLDKPGNRYFACGTAGHCDEGMKVKIKTLAANQTASSSPASASSSSSSAFSLGSGSWSLIAVMSVGFGWIALA
ncbi:hypothetical protein ACLOJK_039831 [Asimina triloba]